MFKLKITAGNQDAWTLIGRLQSPCPRIVFWRAIINKTTRIEGDIEMMLLTDSQEVDLAIKPLTKKNHPAQVDGVPVWMTSDPLIAAITPAADGLSCIVKAADNLGSAQISVTADVDLGSGVQNMTGTLDIEVIAGGAAAISIIAGTPREQT